MMKRFPASRMLLEELHGGYIVRKEGDFEHNYLLTSEGRKIYRVKSVGILLYEPAISEDGAYSSVVVTDFSEAARCVAFREEAVMVEGLRRGDIVQLMGRPTEWREEKQIILEAIGKVPPNMITLHRVEVLTERRIHKASLDDAVMLLEETKNVRKAREEAKLRGMNPEIIEIVDELKLQKEREEEEPLVVDKEDFLKGKIMDIIINLGGDRGVEYDTIVGQLPDFKEDEIDKAVHDLLAEGEIFEPRINRFVRV
jgi:hypothetical protein